MNNGKIFIDSNHTTLYGPESNNEYEIIHRSFPSELTKIFCNNPMTMHNNAPQHFTVRNIADNNVVGEVVFKDESLKKIDGLADEELILMLIARLRYFQRSKYACTENESAICALTSALYALKASVNKRKRMSIEDID